MLFCFSLSVCELIFVEHGIKLRFSFFSPLLISVASLEDKAGSWVFGQTARTQDNSRQFPQEAAFLAWRWGRRGHLGTCSQAGGCLCLLPHCSTKPGVTKYGHLGTSVSLCGLVWAPACSLRALVLQVRCPEDGSGFFSCQRKRGCFTESQVASCPGGRCCLVAPSLQVSSYSFHVLSVRRWPGCW